MVVLLTKPKETKIIVPTAGGLQTE